MNEQKSKNPTILDSLRSELDAIDKEIRGAEKCVAKVAEQLDREKSHLSYLKIRRNKLRLDFKVAKP